MRFAFRSTVTVRPLRSGGRALFNQVTKLAVYALIARILSFIAIYFSLFSVFPNPFDNPAIFYGQKTLDSFPTNSILSAVAIAPIVESLLLCGAVLILRRIGCAPAFAVFVSSLLGLVLHFLSAGPMAAISGSIAYGTFACLFLADRKSNLGFLACWVRNGVCHSIYNTITLIVFYVGPSTQY
jgi:hypothetical protein